MRTEPITIVGGGLAGLTLGIGLRRNGVPVTVWEAGRYPRHRVCGEFISGRGQETLARLGLREVLDRAGAIRATTSAFFTAAKSSLPQRLPVPAICLSRFDMDRALAEEFCRLGGELLEGKRWQAGEPGEGVVRGTGRRLVGEENGSRWFGLKIHARGVPLSADLEMHVSTNSYVGLCRVNDGAVNVCGLFRRRSQNGSAQDARRLLLGQPGSALNKRLAAAEFDEGSFCAVAGLSLGPQRAGSHAEFCIGDAITMIPPMTGNGMSMAFESAEMAIEPVAAWTRGEVTWLQAQEQFAAHCDAAFSRRLTWAKWFQGMALSPVLQNLLVVVVSRSEWFWRSAFERTR